MNLQYLRAFYETVNHNSISKAAKSLHLTQPGLSLQLQNLEKELNASLLIRSNKGVELTEEGRVVYDYADTLLSIQGNIERDLKNIQTESNLVMIGSCKSVGDYALPCTLYTFKQLYKNVDIQFEVSSSAEVIDKLLDHSINIGIIQHKSINSEIELKSIISDELLLVGNSKDAPDKVDMEKLKTMPLILREKNSGTRYLVEEALEKKHIELSDLHIVYSLNSLEAIKSSILAGKGYSFLPRLIFNSEFKNGEIKVIEIPELSIKFDYYIATRKNYVLSTFEKLFVDFVISSKRGFC